ncbi:hypothetical protein [Deinococcus sp.]|uniref:hypothetical protein n=1 Tax=Deinococcus sp. TaxID=47478 RepID=UPI0025BC1D35|nr:hypothetical protein [Deinococcus sp.]
MVAGSTLLQLSLSGGAAFREVPGLLRGLTLAEAQAEFLGVPYALADLLAHLHATTRVSLDPSRGKTARWPEELVIWPDGPGTHAALDGLLGDSHLMLTESQMLAADPSSAARDILTDLAVHHAYHWSRSPCCAVNRATRWPAKPDLGVYLLGWQCPAELMSVMIPACYLEFQERFFSTRLRR